MDGSALLLAFGLVVLNGFFVASEFALVKIRPSRLEELIRARRFGARAAQKILENIDGHLSAAQLGVTLASLALGWMGIPAVARMLEHLTLSVGLTPPTWINEAALVLAFSLLGFLHISIGELVPKSLAILRSESIALLAAHPIRFVHALLYPAIWALGGVSTALVEVMGVRNVGPPETNGQLSEDDIRSILDQASGAGLLSSERAQVLRRALTLPAKNVRDLMVPRNDVVFLDVNLSVEDNLGRAMDSGHSRFPLCDRELDNVLGILDIRDVLFARESRHIDMTDGKVLESFCSPAIYFPEVMSAERLLAEFRARHIAMAVIVDEYGGASGIVSPADVVSAVMGELEDDDDDDVVRLPGGAYDVEGTAPLEEVEEALHVTLEPHDTRTVAGFLMERLGRMPKTGDRVVESGLVFTVVDVQGPRVNRVRITRQSPIGRDSRPERVSTTRDTQELKEPVQDPRSSEPAGRPLKTGR